MSDEVIAKGGADKDAGAQAMTDAPSLGRSSGSPISRIKALDISVPGRELRILVIEIRGAHGDDLERIVRRLERQGRLRRCTMDELAPLLLRLKHCSGQEKEAIEDEIRSLVGGDLGVSISKSAKSVPIAIAPSVQEHSKTDFTSNQFNASNNDKRDSTFPIGSVFKTVEAITQAVSVLSEAARNRKSEADMIEMAERSEHAREESLRIELVSRTDGHRDIDPKFRVVTQADIDAEIARYEQEKRSKR